MRDTAMRYLAGCATLFLIWGCNGTELVTPPRDSGADVEDDAVEDVVADVVDEEVMTGPEFEELFLECSDETDCDEDEICSKAVCAREPIDEATLWLEEDLGEEIILTPVDSAPDFSCWETPEALGDADPAVATAQGDVDLFGTSARTTNLCVTAYDEELFLRWMVWLEENVCEAFHDIDTREQVPYVNCFALDPCRCEDEEFTANRGDAGESVEACYAEIGYCAAITDETLQAECRANILERTGFEADTLVYGSVRSTDNPDDPVLGLYEMAELPTNTRLVFKVSGSISRWRDTYEYGAMLPASDVDEDGRIEWVPNAITEGTWQTITLSAGLPRPIPADHVALAGAVHDCSDNNDLQVKGARIGVVTDPERITFFNGNPNDPVPSPGQIDTNRDGLYAAIDAPAGINRVAAVAMQDGETVSAGARSVFAPPYAVVIATFEGDWE